MSERKLYLLEKLFLGFLFLGSIFFASISIYTQNPVWLVFTAICIIFIVPVLWGFISSFVPQSTSDKIRSRIEQTLSFIFASSLLLIGIGIFGYQVYSYLRFGSWLPFSVIDLMVIFNIEWAESPIDWLGVWEILNKIPVSVFFIGLSILAFNSYDKNALGESKKP
jgi:hypothetical protein